MNESGKLDGWICFHLQEVLQRRPTGFQIPSGSKSTIMSRVTRNGMLKTVVNHLRRNFIGAHPNRDKFAFSKVMIFVPTVPDRGLGIVSEIDR